MHIRVIGVPMDLGADRRGVDIGASAIRYAGLNDQLRRLDHQVYDAGNIVVPQPESQPIGNPRVKYLEPIVKVAEELADVVTATLQESEFPLILGGDHSVSLGSITGVTRVYSQALADGRLSSIHKELLLLAHVILTMASANFYAHITFTSLQCLISINVAFQRLCARLLLLQGRPMTAST